MPSDGHLFSCPKINPYVAYCIVIIIFLFTYYQRNDINTFITSMFNNANNTMNDTMTEHSSNAAIATNFTAKVPKN